MLRRHGVVGKVRRVLRPRRRLAVARGPRHYRQHGAGVRRHLRLLPGRRGDAALSRRHRPGDRSASRSSKPTPRRRDCSAPSRRPIRCSPTPRARPRRRRALARRTQASAGSRAAVARQGRASPTPSTRNSARRRARPSASRSRARRCDLGHGDVVIAAITSCTNTSNPSVMIGAGLLGPQGARRRAST